MNATLFPMPPRTSPDGRHRYHRAVSRFAGPASSVAVADDDLRLTDDPQSLKDAYDRHGALVYTYCRRRLGEDFAKDATQEIFLSAWNARGSFDASRGNLAAWLMGIAKNRVIDALRSERRHADRRAERDGDATTEPGREKSDPGDPERVADRMLVADGLDRLAGCGKSGSWSRVDAVRV